MNTKGNTNGRIHGRLAMAADALSRARDDLKSREKVTAVSIYSFQQMKRAIEDICKAYRMALENSLICDANLTALFAISEDLAEMMRKIELFPDVIEPFTPDEPPENAA